MGKYSLAQVRPTNLYMSEMARLLASFHYGEDLFKLSLFKLSLSLFKLSHSLFKHPLFTFQTFTLTCNAFLNVVFKTLSNTEPDDLVGIATGLSHPTDRTRWF